MRLKLKLLILSILYFNSNLYSQEEVDKNQQYNKILNTLSLKELDRLSVQLAKVGDTAKTISVGRFQIEKSKKEGNSYYRARGYFTLYDMSITQRDKHRYTDSMLFYGRESKKGKIITDALYTKSNTFYEGGDYLNSMKLLNEAYKQAVNDNNFDYIERIQVRMGAIKSVLGQHFDSYKSYLEYYKKFENVPFSDIKKKKRYLSNIYNLSRAHSYLGEYDSTIYYSEKGKYILETNKDQYYSKKYKRVQAIAYFKKGNLNLSRDLFLASINVNNKYDLAETYYYIGAIKLKQNHIDEALQYFNKSDSVLINSNTGKFKDAKKLYKTLHKIYTDRGDKSIGNIYLNRFFEIDSIEEALRLNVGEKVTSLYDLPKIKRIEEISFYRRRLYRIIFGVLLVIISILLIRYRIVKKNIKKQKRIINDILQGNKNIKSSNIDYHIANNQSKRNQLKNLNDDAMNKILNGIKSIETEKLFLDKSISQNSVAKKLQTNTSDLSYVLNNIIGETYPDYIRRLRVSYAIEEMKTNSKYLKYSISGLAEDFGFTNPDTFSRAFKSITKVNPSIFLDELRNNNLSTDNL